MTLHAFSPGRLSGPVLRSFLSKVTVSPAPDLQDAHPRRCAARLWLVLTDGTAIEHEQPIREGDSEDLLTDAELDAKFLEHSEPLGRW